MKKYLPALSMTVFIHLEGHFSMQKIGTTKIIATRTYDSWYQNTLKLLLR